VRRIDSEITSSTLASPYMPRSSSLPTVDSISTQVSMIGTPRMSGMKSRKTRARDGFVVGSRKAGDSATAFNEGTVRPDFATIVCPSMELANSMNAQAASLLSEAAAMQ
jgi:hypothetical protein